MRAQLILFKKKAELTDSAPTAGDLHRTKLGPLSVGTAVRLGQSVAPLAVGPGFVPSA